MSNVVWDVGMLLPSGKVCFASQNTGVDTQKCSKMVLDITSKFISTNLRCLLRREGVHVAPIVLIGPLQCHVSYNSFDWSSLATRRSLGSGSITTWADKSFPLFLSCPFVFLALAVSASSFPCSRQFLFPIFLLPYTTPFIPQLLPPPRHVWPHLPSPSLALSPSPSLS